MFRVVLVMNLFEEGIFCLGKSSWDIELFEKLKELFCCDVFVCFVCDML